MNNHEKEDNLTLGILETIENKNDVTQRHLADELNVALGLANSYLKRCVKKGLIKIHEAPANRYLYYLTPQGFAEKSRLTAQYLTSSFDFYRKAGDSFRTIFSQAERNSDKKIMFCGMSELAEIASIRIKDYELEYIANYEAGSELKEFLNTPVWCELSKIKDIDACVITTFIKPQVVYKELLQKMAKEKIFVPEILNLNI